jgi:hypothetical protein
VSGPSSELAGILARASSFWVVALGREPVWSFSAGTAFLARVLLNKRAVHSVPVFVSSGRYFTTRRAQWGLSKGLQSAGAAPGPGQHDHGIRRETDFRDRRWQLHSESSGA